MVYDIHRQSAMSQTDLSQFIKHLIAASKYSAEKEPGVYKYCVCVPADSSNEKTAWVIEEYMAYSTTFRIGSTADSCRYEDKKTLDDHMASTPVRSMLDFVSTNPIVEGTPKIRYLSWIDDMVFTKQEVRQQKDPFLVVAELEFESGTRDESLKHWKANLDSSREESGCFIYGFAKDPEQPNRMYTFEVYENEDFLWNTHFKAAAVQETIEKTKDVRKNVTLSKLKMVNGYLARES